MIFFYKKIIFNIHDSLGIRNGCSALIENLFFYKYLEFQGYFILF